MHAEEEIQQMQDVGFGWIEDELDGFRMPRVALVGGAVVLPASVTAFGIKDARQAAEKLFHPPEASAGKD